MRKLVLFATVAVLAAAPAAFAQTHQGTTSQPRAAAPAAGGTASTTTTTSPTQSRAEVVTAAEFARMAAISDMFEIQSAQLAMQRTQNQQVRQFAQEMIQDHQKSTNELQQLLRQMHGAATPPGRPSGAAASNGSSHSAAATPNGSAAGSAAGNARTGSSAATTGATGSGGSGSSSTLAQAIQLPTQLDPQHQQKLQQLQQAQGAAFDRLYAQQQLEAHRTAVDMFQNYGRSGDNAQLRQFAERTLPVLQGHLRKAQQLETAVGHG